VLAGPDFPMLTYLKIENFALIERLELEFGPGLNLITGETGSGKSILVDAVELLVGGRASQEMIRQGADTARLEGVFQVGDSVPLREAAARHGLGPWDPDQLIIRREISRTSGNRVFINDRLCTLAVLSEIGSVLADVHGQHSQQLLLQPSLHLELLDRFGDLEGKRGTVAEAFHRWRQVRDRLDGIRRSERERLQRIDLLQFQCREVDELRLSPGLVESLEEERRLLASAERRLEAAQAAWSELYESDTAAVVILERVRRLVEELAGLDPRCRQDAEALENLKYQIEEVAFHLREYAAGLEYDPTQLELLEERLDRIERIRRKYADSIEELLSLRAAWETELSRLVHSEEEAAELEEQVGDLEKAYFDAARALSSARREAARRLSELVEEQLGDLAMAKARFQVSFSEAPEPTERGLDEVEFRFSANPGEEPRPLVRIASGGELSRLALAVKVLIREGDGSRTLVFDEVDAGIGGRTASALAEKLARVAAGRQVFCVTHLPQIAAYAREHFHVGKEIREGRTVIQARRLSLDERIEELARLLAGERLSETSRRQARELLEAAQAV